MFITAAQQEALDYCSTHQAEIRAAAFNGTPEGIMIWGAYVGVKQGNTYSAREWLVEKFAEYKRTMAHA